MDNKNPVEKIFWGKVMLQHAMAYYYFNKGDKVQRLVHALKYKGLGRVGVEVGQLYGIELNESGILFDVDYIIPIPLHPKKLKSRGYNQAERFGEGLSLATKIPCLPYGIVRKKNTETQTKKSQFERWLNVDSVFCVENPEQLVNKHVLLVDDVVTTGSTLEACAQILLEIEGTKVSIATMAYAQ